MLCLLKNGKRSEPFLGVSVDEKRMELDKKQMELKMVFVVVNR